MINDPINTNDARTKSSKIGAMMALFAAFTGCLDNVDGEHESYKADIPEYIGKGMSAEEMGTAGKRKKSRRERKLSNKKRR